MGGTAYDRVGDPTQQVPMDPAQAAPPQGAPQVQQPVPDAPVGILANMGGSTTDDLTGNQLAALDPNAAQTDPAELEFQQLQDALNDPNTPPDQKAAIEQQIALAARRSMLGGR